MGSLFHRQGAAYLKERFMIFKEERVDGTLVVPRWSRSAKLTYVGPG